MIINLFFFSFFFTYQQLLAILITAFLSKSLHRSYNISDVAVRWFQHYTSGHTQKVLIIGDESVSYPLSYGLPQASVLGQTLFNMYTYDLGEIITTMV